MDNCRGSVQTAAVLHGAASLSAGVLALMFGMAGCGVEGDEVVELGEKEQALAVCAMESAGVYRCTVPAYAETPAGWWQDSGIDIAVGDRITLAFCNGFNRPWPGHTGFGCAGSPTTFWTEALSNVCTFGSLVGRIGTNGWIYCIGNNGPWSPLAAGRLYLAFNDGVSFADNEGEWRPVLRVGKMVCETLQGLAGQVPLVGLTSVAMSAGNCTATHERGTINLTAFSQTLALFPAGFNATFAEQNVAACALVKEAVQLCKTGTYQQPSEPQMPRTKLCHPGAELGCVRFTPNFPQIFQTAGLSWTPGEQEVPHSYCSGQVKGSVGYALSVPMNRYQWSCTAAEATELNQNASQVANALGWPSWPTSYSNCDGANAGSLNCNRCRVSRALRQCVLPNLGAASSCTVAGTTMTGMQYANFPGYCFDIVQLTGGVAGSSHAAGRAMDLNNYAATAAPHNNGNIFASGGTKVMNVLLTPQLDLPPAFVSLMEGCGFDWGGRWWMAESVRLACDPMHFELPQ